MNLSTVNRDDSLLRFATSDPDEFVENISGIAPGLICSSQKPRDTRMEICAANLPKMGIFRSTLKNFRVQSSVRPFYGVTIPLSGHSEFLVGSTFEDINKARVHLQLPDKPFDAKMGEAPLDSLQLCFDKTAMDSFTMRLQESEGRDADLMTILDMARPEAQSFVRHAIFIWNELLRGGAIRSSPMIAQESVYLLQALLVSAAGTTAENTKSRRTMPNHAGVRRAEEYLMANLSNPISIADVAIVAGMSARNLSREFRRRRGCTIKEFIRDHRLEAVNRVLLAVEPGETSVSLVAIDFGFEQLGRFSRDYKKAFGELPSETLAR